MISAEAAVSCGAWQQGHVWALGLVLAHWWEEPGSSTGSCRAEGPGSSLVLLVGQAIS